MEALRKLMLAMAAHVRLEAMSMTEPMRSKLKNSSGPLLIKDATS